MGVPKALQKASCIATAVASFVWPLAEWMVRGKPSVLGFCSGAVAGLVGITPAAGFVTPMSALIIGLSAGVVCYFMCAKVKHIFGYDDSLDVFGVHAVGGIVGAILTGEPDALLGGPPVKALFIQNTNPMVVAPDLAKVRAGFARADLFVCEATYQDALMGAPVHLSAREAGDLARRASAFAISKGRKEEPKPEKPRTIAQTNTTADGAEACATCHGSDGGGAVGFPNLANPA